MDVQGRSAKREMKQASMIGSEAGAAVIGG